MKWMKEWSAQPTSKNEQISTEGLFDIFKKKLKVQRGYKGKIRLDDALKKFIRSKLSNKKWVAENLQADKKVHLTAAAKDALLELGNVTNLIASLDKFKNDAFQQVEKYRAAYIQYDKETDIALKEIEAFYLKNSKDVQAVKKFAEEAIKKVHVPPYTDPFSDEGLIKKHEARKNAPEIKLPQLTVDQVVLLANKALAYLESGTALESSLPYVGGDFQEKFWDDTDGYDGSYLRDGNVSHFFYEQGEPEDVRWTMLHQVWDLEEICLAIIDWIGQLTGAINSESVSNEDLREDLDPIPVTIKSTIEDRLRRLAERRTGKDVTSEEMNTWDDLTEAVMADINKKYPAGVLVQETPETRSDDDGDHEYR